LIEYVSLAAALIALSVVVWPQARELVAPAAFLTAVVSLAVTVSEFVRGAGRSDEVLLAEEVAIIAVIFVVVRRAPARQAVLAAAAACAAGAAMIIPDPPPDDPYTKTTAGIAFWSIFGFGAVGAAVYLNALEARRARSVAEARRSQRLELARDLHDFVAHDVSAIVVQAQAARVVAREPAQALAALKQIEEAGLAALASMDRSLRALREVDEAVPERGESAGQPRRLYRLDDLAELTERFSGTGAAKVHLAVEPGLIGQLAAEVSETGYRVAVEALTNIRRHAPGATRVEVAVALHRDLARPALVLRVVNGGGGRGMTLEARRSGGCGLIGLRERVEAMGGTLTAGPREPDGWCVTAVLPLAARPDAGAPRP